MKSWRQAMRREWCGFDPTHHIAKGELYLEIEDGAGRKRKRCSTCASRHETHVVEEPIADLPAELPEPEPEPEPKTGARVRRRSLVSVLTLARRRVAFEVFGVAVAKGSARSFGFLLRDHAGQPVIGKNGKPIIRTATTNANPKTKGWEQLVREQAQTVAAAGVFVGPVVLTVTFRLPRPQSLPKRSVHHTKKPDVDKLVRATNDALTGVLYIDDSQVVDLHARKCYAAIGATPSAHITVEEACDPDPAHLDLVGDGSLFP
jgi:Holliday junction resolvase RusA-like endonuclease